MPHTPGSETRRPRTPIMRSPRLWLPLLGVMCVGLTSIAILNPAGVEPTPLPESIEGHASDTAQSPRSLSAYGTNAVIRTQGGSCSLPASVEISGDNGHTWSIVDIAGQARLGAVLGVTLESPTRASISGYDNKTCDTKYAVSATNGVTWERTHEVAPSYFDNNYPYIYVLEDSELDLPCAAKGAASNGEMVAALCENGDLVTSTDYGSQWNTLASETAGTAVAVTPESVLIAQPTDNCAGLAIISHTEQKVPVEGACLTIPSGVKSPISALATSENTLYLWADTIFATSTDLGRSWN